MAILLQPKSDRRQVLGSPCLVGRSSACALRIDDRRVSGEHARIAWTGVDWEVRDLGSRNGTWVDGRRLNPGTPERLVPGSRLGFGRESDAWELIDATPPTAMARHEGSGELRVADAGMLALPPESDAPIVVVVEESPGVWMVEQGERCEPASDQQLVDVAGEAWRILIPWIHETTLSLDAPQPLDELGLRFVVSRDQEHVELHVRHVGGEVAMTPRVHHFLLLLLARKRLEDRANVQLPEQEHGWTYVEELVGMLQTDAERLNVDVYRIRRQFAEAGLPGATRLIERRRLTRQLRLATATLEIVQH
jgi:hypothetical protein